MGSSIHTIVISENSKLVMTGDDSGQVKQFIFNENTLQMIDHPTNLTQAHKGAITSMVIHLQGKYLFTAGHDGSVKQWS